MIQLDTDVEGYLRASEVSRDRVGRHPHPAQGGRQGDRDGHQHRRKNRTINLSGKARDVADEAEAMKKLSEDKQAATGTTNLGALLKAKLDVANTQQ